MTHAQRKSPLLVITPDASPVQQSIPIFSAMHPNSILNRFCGPLSCLQHFSRWLLAATASIWKSLATRRPAPSAGRCNKGSACIHSLGERSSAWMPALSKSFVRCSSAVAPARFGEMMRLPVAEYPVSFTANSLQSDLIYRPHRRQLTLILICHMVCPIAVSSCASFSQCNLSYLDIDSSSTSCCQSSMPL
jgi:hypothetical protein